MELLIASPIGCWDASIPAAAARAGATGLLNLAFLSSPSIAAASARELAATAAGRYGLILHGRLGEVEEAALSAIGPVDLVLLFPESEQDLQLAVERCRNIAKRLGIVATCLEGALLAKRLGFDLIVAKGNESGGVVGEETTFVLLQRLMATVDLPVLAWGGVGLNVMAACAVGGAAGVLLDWQLALTRECGLPLRMRDRIAVMDGTESVVVSGPQGRQLRLFWRPGMPARDELQKFSAELAGLKDPEAALAAWCERIASLVSADNVDDRAWLVGQDGAFAANLSQQGRSVGAVLRKLRERTDQNLLGAAKSHALGANGPLARSHGTRYPIVQGPMTRVSDVAEFSLAVAEGGALPLAALALMRADQVRQLLQDERRLLGDRAWGAGVLGFLDHELWQEQVRVVEEVRPPFAIIAGGRPDQARSLEERGICTYLHVASPVVLGDFLREGARRFVLEGRECGGHVGPRTSFVLWESSIRVLLESQLSAEQFAEVHVLFAGGIHDGRSAAMVAALAQPLVEQGIKIGVLIGTAYLFTHEIVSTGAVVPGFQQMAIETDNTVLLETGPGHSTRCAPSTFYRDFCDARTRLNAERRPFAEIRDHLENLNLGRLRIGAKGIERQAAGPGGLVQIDDAAQRERGMYMLGQVAALHQRTFTVQELHDSVCEGACELLDALDLSALGNASKTEEPVPAATDIAIVGMSCLLPGARNLGQFWENILAGKDSITEVPADRFDWRRWYEADGHNSDRFRSRWGGFLDDIAFDPLKYGIPPASIPSIEPMQLLALELVDSALRDSGYGEEKSDRRRTSVVFGVGGGLAELGCQYVVRSLLPQFVEEPQVAFNQKLPEWTEDSFAGILLNVVSGRVANRFDMGGLNLTVDAACASSLAAVYVACNELASGAADMVISGGCDTLQNPMGYSCFDSAGALSPRGKCRPFDVSADGIAISEGLAAVVLKRREDAERDGDRIYAVIRAVASGSDGRTKALTAPGPEGQLQTLQRAYRQARIDPATVKLFEAHGTGTARGDVVEASTLNKFLGENGAQPQSCAIGSVKSNVGHTKCAAGVTGMIKAALSIFHGVLPPTLNVERPNPEAVSAERPLYVNTALRSWIQTNSPRRAGVSAFGFGGTNFHAVLEEYTADASVRDRSMPQRSLPAELFLFGAESTEELASQLVDARELMHPIGEQAAEVDLAKLAYAIYRQGRHQQGAQSKIRAAIVAENLAELSSQLEWLIANVVPSARNGAQPPAGVYLSDASADPGGPLAFVFPGQGAQFPGMLDELAVNFVEVRRAYERVDGALDRSISNCVFPPPAFENDERSRNVERLTSTDVAQPALGACGVGLVRLLESFGIRPQLTAGHSYGELVALFAAGCLDEESLYRLSRDRADAMLNHGGPRSEPEAMLAVRASEEIARSVMTECDGVYLANINSPRQVVLSGKASSIQIARQLLEARGVASTPLAVGCAFHSPHMSRASEQFAVSCANTEFRSPQQAVFGNVTATEHTPDVATIRAKLVEQLTAPVRFAEMIEAMYASGTRLFVEVGPSDILSRLIGEILGSRPHETIPLQSRDRSGLVGLSRALARLFTAGVHVNPERLYEGRSWDDASGATTLHSETTWLINGGYARAAASPKRTDPPLVSVATRHPSVPVAAMISAASPSSNGNGESAVHANGASRAPAIDRGSRFERRRERVTPIAERSQNLPIPAAPVQHASAAGEVVSQFQRNMRELLQTQAEIMRLYLGGTASAGVGPETDTHSLHENGAAIVPAPKVEQPARPARPRKVSVAPRPRVARLESRPAPQPPVQVIAPPATEDLAKVLVRITSEKTGYPPSALKLTAKLEAELGIDSIKRVEIVTAFRRQVVPQLTEPPLWFVQRMISAATLQDIVAGVQELQGPAAGPSQAQQTNVAQPSVAPVQREASLGADELAKVLVKITSEKTGYPPSALKLTAKLEAELGIDSIKRVEIVTAFRRQVIPQLTEPPSWFVQRMISAATLQDIVAGVQELQTPSAVPSQAQPATAAQPSVAPVQREASLGADDLAKVLVKITSEKTGYPPSALKLTAKLEAELGIDSIKRVEIVTAFRRQVIPQLTEPPLWFVQRMISAATLQDIVAGVQELQTPSAGQLPAQQATAAQPSVAPVQREASLGADELAKVLVKITSEKTGYPPSALKLTAKLEAELGIDSIKRVEIVTAFRRQVVPQLTEPPSWFVQRMISAATLQDIVAGVQELTQPETKPAQASPAELAGRNGHSSPTLPGPLPAAAGVNGVAKSSQHAEHHDLRWATTAVQAPPNQPIATLADGVLVVTNDHCGVADKLIEYCASQGRSAVLLDDKVLASREGVATAIAALRKRHGQLAGIVHLAPLANAPVFPHFDVDEWNARIDREVKPLLFLAQALELELGASSKDCVPAVLFAASIGGGHFNELPGAEAQQPWRGALAAILKTVALEWPGLRCRAVDFDELPDVAAVWKELHLTGPVEIGYRDGVRLAIGAAAAPLDDSNDHSSGLDAQSVVLVTGGARGITAEIVLEIAARSQATMVLLGRTALSQTAEPPETAGIDNEIELRQAVALWFERTGAEPTPVKIHATVRQIKAQREILATLSALQTLGVRAKYIECDVRHGAALTEAVESVRREFGEISAVLHGAGVIEDRRMLDKTAESFDRVLGTKLDPVLHLSRLLDPEALKHFVLFSSVAAFWGNPGQVDYGAANAILNSVARRLCGLWPGKVTAIGWGPWDGAGMVTPELAKEFALRGIPLVPIAAGRLAAWREICSPANDVRVLIGRGPWGSAAPAPQALPIPSSERAKQNGARALPNRANRERLSIPLLADQKVSKLENGAVEAQIVLHTSQHRYFLDHQLDRKIVLPLTFALELMVETASVLCPTWRLKQIERVEGLQQLSGAFFDGERCELKVRATPIPLDVTSTNFNVRIVSAAHSERPLYQADVCFAKTPIAATPSHEFLPLDASANLSPTEAYEQMLFHGASFQVIDRIHAINSFGIDATVSSRWAEEDWLMEPFLLDAVPQLVIVWARQMFGTTVLPTSLVAYQQIGSMRRGPCELRLRIVDKPDQFSVCVNVCLLRDDQVVGTMERLTCTGSTALNRLADKALHAHGSGPPASAALPA